MSEQTSIQPVATPPLRAASRKAILRALVTVAVLAAGIAGIRGLEAALHATFDKPPAPLTKKLDLMKKELRGPEGGNVRYQAARADLVLDSDTVQTLGTREYLIREFRDLSKGESEPGAFMNLNVNYYDTGDSTPHVPENCWAGNGREQAGAAEVFDVPGVRRKDGAIETLRVKLVSFKPQAIDLQAAALTGGETSASSGLSATGEPLYSNVAYVFHVNGEYVANTRDVTSRFWKATNKYAYHAKIEMTPMVRLMGLGNNGEGVDRPALCTRAQAKEWVGAFLKSVIPEVEECLPDPSILTRGAPAPAGIPNEVK